MPKIITINLTDEQVACLEHDLLDIDDWVQKAIDGKVNQCTKRLVKEWQPKFFADPDVTSIPGAQDEFIAAVQARPDYKNRAARDADETRKRPL